MKPYKIFLSLFLLLVAYALQAQVTSPDTMMHRIFSALKNKDEKAYVALYPNKEQMAKLLGKMMTVLVTEISKMDTANKKKVDEAELQKRIVEMLQEKTTPEQLEKEYAKFGKKFKSFIKEGESKGIDWSTSELTRYTLDTSSAEKDPVYNMFNGIKKMKGKIFLRSSGKEHELTVTEVLFLPEEGGWYGAELKWAGNNLGLEDEEVKMKDVIVEGESAVGPPPPPPPPAKAKRKTKTTTTKPKTKTKASSGNL